MNDSLCSSVLCCTVLCRVSKICFACSPSSFSSICLAVIMSVFNSVCCGEDTIQDNTIQYNTTLFILFGNDSGCNCKGGVLLIFLSCHHHSDFRQLTDGLKTVFSECEILQNPTFFYDVFEKDCLVPSQYHVYHSACLFLLF